MIMQQAAGACLMALFLKIIFDEMQQRRYPRRLEAARCHC